MLMKLWTRSKQQNRTNKLNRNKTKKKSKKNTKLNAEMPYIFFSECSKVRAFILFFNRRCLELRMKLLVNKKPKTRNDRNQVNKLNSCEKCQSKVPRIFRECCKIAIGARSVMDHASKIDKSAKLKPTRAFFTVIFVSN